MSDHLDGRKELQMQRRIMPRSRNGLFLKSCCGAVGLFAVLGCSNPSIGDQVSANNGTQNPILLQHMGLSDTSYSSMQGHDGDRELITRHHHQS
jgi:hypothetical protein